eukprot:gene8041-12505_t
MLDFQILFTDISRIIMLMVETVKDTNSQEATRVNNYADSTEHIKWASRELEQPAQIIKMNK